MNSSSRTTILDKGWSLTKNVLTPEEVSYYREYCLHKNSEDTSFFDRLDIATDDVLRNLIIHPKIVTKVQEILDEVNPIYFCDSSVRIGTERYLYGFHKDCVDRFDQNGEEWKCDEYPIIRLGLYFQDHSSHSGGLALQSYSHKKVKYTGSGTVVPSKEGDLISWYLTTNHSGNAIRFKKLGDYALPTRPVPARLYRFMMPKYLFYGEEKTRVAIFITFAKKHPITDRYLEYLKTRKYAVLKAKNQQYSDVEINLFSRCAINLLNFNEELQNIDIANTSFDTTYDTRRK